jgi:carbon-monoxide dehydrogenase large subunit
MTAFVLGLPEHKVRVVAPDVGGGFGSKIFLYGEETALVWASKRVGRPIKWTAERSESFLSDAHGRDHFTTAELALDKDGKFLALRVHTTANLGAYLSTFASCVPTILYATLLAGQYTTPAIYCEVKAVFTNTAPVDAVRGAGRPEATYVVERIVETAARELKIDPAELRRRNFIKTFPYATPVGLAYDTGDYEATLKRAQEIADIKGFAARKAESEKKGMLRARLRLLHRGLAESRRRTSRVRWARAPVCSRRAKSVCTRPARSPCSPARTRTARTRDDFFSGRGRPPQHPAGRCRYPAWRHRQGLFGMGTYGSRSIAVGGTPSSKRSTGDRQGRRLRRTCWSREADIEFLNGEFRVLGTDRKKAFAEVSLAAYVPHNYPLDKLEPGLNENAFYDPTNFTYPAGSYLCEVESIPPPSRPYRPVRGLRRFWQRDQPDDRRRTGARRRCARYDRRFRAGIYNEDGQLVTGSYMDYAMPRADDLPTINVETVKGTPCTHNPLGVKGCAGRCDRLTGGDHERRDRRCGTSA